MLFESHHWIGNRKKIKFIITISYMLIMLVLYFSYIVSARHNALLWIEGDMQKRLDSLFLSMDADFNSRVSDVNSIIENNSVIMPLSLGFKDQITDFMNGSSRKLKRGLNEVLITDSSNQIIFNTSKSFQNLDKIPFSEKQYSCFIYNRGLFRIAYAPVYYRDASTGEKGERVGTVIAVYDFSSFSDAISKCVGDNRYNIYGYTEGRLKFVISGGKLSFIDNPVKPSSLKKLKAGFTSLTIDGSKIFSFIRDIPLPDSGLFMLSLSIPAQKYTSIENGYIISSVISCTLVVLIISLIIFFVFFLLKYYLGKELQNKLEIQNLRVQKHDFSKHLNILNGMAQTEEYGELKDYLESLCKKVVFNSELLKLENAPVNVLIQEKEALAHEKDLKFSIDIRASLRNIRMEPTDLCSILSNLIDNAIEACEDFNSTPRHVAVRVLCDESFYIFKISNTGNPIPEELLEKIFRPGYSTKQGDKGRGMGLYIVRKTLKKYKGGIEVESNKSSTTFTVFIPRVDSR